MFGLREKLALSHAVLLVVVMALGFQSVRQLMTLKSNVDTVFTVELGMGEAADDMRVGLGLIHTGIAAVLVGHPEVGLVKLDDGKAAFAEALANARKLANTPSEHEFVVQMQEHFEQSLTLIDRILDTSAPQQERADVFVKELQPLMVFIREAAVDREAINRRETIIRNNQTGAQIAAAQWQTAAVLSIALVVAVAAIYFAGRWILIPILKLTHAAEQVRLGNYATVVTPPSQDELGTLTLTFNRMAAELNEMHQLRTAEFLRVQRSRERVLEHLDDAIALVAPNGFVETSTRVAAEVFGLEAGKQVSEALFDWVIRIYDRALECNEVATLDEAEPVKQIFVRGEERFFYPQGICLRNDDDEPSGVLLLFRDITQLRLQEELKRDAVATVSHQLKTPLTSIRMALLLLKDRKFGDLNVQQADLLDTAADESDRLFRMVQGLLDMSRIKSGRVLLECEAIPVEEILLTTVEPLRQQAEVNLVSIQVNAPYDLPDLWADPSRIEHVFTNLLSNAIKYSPPGGRVFVTARPEPEWVRFDFEDVGSGIPEEYLDRVFEQFFRVPGQEGASGAGLGLAIVKQIVEAHGGRIEAHNRDPKGACFTVWLPRADAAQALGLNQPPQNANA